MCQKIIDRGFTIASSHPNGIDKSTILIIKCENGHFQRCSYGNFSRRKIKCKQCNYEFKLSRNAITDKDRYDDWRNSVLIRDNYTCQCCELYNEKLHVHHIESFMENEELRYEIDNGIVLCADCHNPNIYGSFHNVYGTINNTREELEEYIAIRKKYNLNIKTK